MPSLTKVQSGFMEAQGALPLSSGTAAAPGLKFDDHAGTGMFSPSTGEIAFSTSGHSQAVTFKTDGKVGIGIANPAEILHLNGATTSSLLRFTSGTYGTASTDGSHIGINFGGLEVWHKENNYLRFGTNNTERLRITSTGKLEAYKGTSTTGKTSGSEAFTVGNGAGNHRFAVYPDGTTVIGGTGLIGNYNILLQNDGVGVFDNQLLIGLTTGVGVGGVPADLNSTEVGRGFINISRDDTAAADHILFGKNGSIAASIGTDTTNTLVFKTGTSEALRITSDGRVGINATGPNALLTVGPVNSPTFYRGTAAIKATNDDNSIDTCLYLEEASGAEGWQLSVASNGELNFHNSGASASTLKLGDDNLVTAKALHITDNITPTSGRGVEIFEASAGVGQIQSYNRTGTSWDELRLKGSEVGIYTGTSNSIGLYLQSTQSTLYGTSDGILNLDTTDARGAFIRFKQSGTTKGWAGCSEGLGTGGDQDDFGIRAVGGFRVKTGTTNRIEISEEGQILFSPITGGFGTSGAAGTFPGAAVAIDCHGIGAGTGTNIPNYGLYVDAVASSNDATLMTGIYTISKQNTEGPSIGIHGLYERDWNSYARKIGGLFQAPARSPRYTILAMNPGGGSFINTTDTGHANKLAPGANQPSGTADGNATYGDCTGLWGDVFRSDTDTSSELVKSIAIKATNRTTHGDKRIGLMVAIVDGNDSTDNSKNTQFVEYYTNSSHQKYYARNHKKEVNVNYPLMIDANSGTRNTTYSTSTGKYYYQHDVGANQYSWYYWNCYAASYARNGRLKIDIAWTTGHASGVGEGSYCVAHTIHHGDSRVYVRRFTRFHEYNVGGSYYGWSSSPHLDIYQSTSTGHSAGIYLRVRGHISWGGYCVNAIRIKADENDYGFSKESSFKFVSNTTPSDADTTTGAITISTPNVS
jgi:hypothetical protein